MSTRARGRFGESFAAARLEEQGYLVLARNWRKGRSEIDLIARRAEVVAFVEVKLRSLNALATPAASVRPEQRRRIALAAAEFLKEAGLYNTGEVQPRFDVFEITVRCPGSSDVIDYYHMEHAYDLEGLGVFL